MVVLGVSPQSFLNTVALLFLKIEFEMVIVLSLAPKKAEVFVTPLTVILLATKSACWLYKILPSPDLLLVNVKLEIVNVTPFVLLLNIVNRPPPDIVNDACPVPVMVRLRVTAGRSAVNTIELIDPENSIVSSLALAFANIIAAWREPVTLPPSAEVTGKVVADAIAP